ncbi:GDSL-type esterase/lipase family protein [Paraclostridium bifermentans]|uniref:GDSL-type esterase/lipase family protein n=1 Tax=Paraclostridium bifermentans TaxID=1490 RepID=UPI001A9B04BC|nr:GDSL-type esterase/lipase family protein [Paraclostridium bifermentans]
MKILLIGVSLLILLSFARHIYKSKFGQAEANPEKGVAKIKELESEDISSIRNEIEKNSDDNSDIDKNKVDVNFDKVFEDSVIMGDSRSEGLTAYGILSPSSVVAYKGRNVIEAKGDVSEVVDLSPNNVFLTYGMNDLELFSNSKDFINKYEILINDVKRKLPSSKIYVTSIIPTTQAAIEKEPSFKQVYTFNKALEDMCKKLNLEFINVNNSVNSKENLYEPDGIHFSAKFYNGYLNILKNKANL